jgi:succinylglutamate desuccinylase
MSALIQRIAIVGGTHGNERTGVYLLKKFEQSPELIQRSSFRTITLLANPRAVETNQRYVDRDLNRCFLNRDLNNSSLDTYEDARAREIVDELGSKKNPNVDVIIDLHSTTANMGITVLPSSRHPANLQLSAYLSKTHPAVRVCCSAEFSQDTPMLQSLSPLGCAIEVGAIAQGVLNARQFEQTEMLIHAILDYFDAINHGSSLPVPSSLTVYQAISPIDYPRNSAGELQAMIHPELQFRDYEPLHVGDPMFLTFTGETIPYQGKSTVFPVFINEAAYYEKGIAMILTEKQELIFVENSEQQILRTPYA